MPNSWTPAFALKRYGQKTGINLDCYKSSYDSAYVDQWHLDNAGGLETSWHHDSSEPALMFFVEHVNSLTVNL